MIVIAEIASIDRESIEFRMGLMKMWIWRKMKSMKYSRLL